MVDRSKSDLDFEKEVANEESQAIKKNMENVETRKSMHEKGMKCNLMQESSSEKRTTLYQKQSD